MLQERMENIAQQVPKHATKVPPSNSHECQDAELLSRYHQRHTEEPESYPDKTESATPEPTAHEAASSEFETGLIIKITLEEPISDSKRFKVIIFKTKRNTAGSKTHSFRIK